MYRVALQINELKALVINNKETLAQLRTSFEKPEMMTELAKKLEGADNVLQRYDCVIIFHMDPSGLYTPTRRCIDIYTNVEKM